MREQQVILWVLRAILGGFFIWSGYEKMKDLSDFTQTVANYKMIDRPWDALVAYFVPCLEIVVGLALIVGVFAQGGLAILMLMLLGFSGAIAWVWHQGLNINCGCYGKGDDPTNYPVHLAINAGLFLFTAALFFFQSMQERTRPSNVVAS